MISPASDTAWQPPDPATSPERRRKVARKWAYLISLTAYMPMPHAEIELELHGLVTRIFDAMTSEPMPTDRVAAVGARLVELHCVGKASLQCSIDVLAGALLAEPELNRFDKLPERVAHLLGALASGYVDATRMSTLEQQDNLHRALLEAMWVSERRLRTSNFWLDEIFALAPSGIAITDLTGRFTRTNAAFDELVTHSTDQPTLFDTLDVRAAYRSLFDGTAARLDLQLDVLSLTAALLRDADGEPTHYVTIVSPR
jgi:PAS domain-containing protein